MPHPPYSPDLSPYKLSQLPELEGSFKWAVFVWDNANSFEMSGRLATLHFCQNKAPSEQLGSHVRGRNAVEVK
ncbi:hypothetical protein TNCV_3574451 [Trichonephila clavipes]|nr:hypothetical protein TNCV_3574451 [Trichonephila clavipes]